LLIACVKVDGGLPVAVGFRLTPKCLPKAMVMICVDDPVVE